VKLERVRRHDEAGLFFDRKLRREARRSAGRAVISEGGRRCGRLGPWIAGEIEELQHIRLHRIAVGEVCRAIDELVLDKLDDRGVIHRGVRDIVTASPLRDDHVRQTEAELGCESLDCGSVVGVSAWVTRSQIAMRSAVGHAWIVTVGIDCDGRDVGDGAERRAGVLVGGAGHRRHVIIRAATFIVTPEEDGVTPRRAGHEGVKYVGDLCLTFKDGLTGAGMLIVVTVAGFNEGELGERAVGEVCEVLRERRDVVGIDAEGVTGVADYAGRLRGSGACCAGGIVVEVVDGVTQAGEVSGRVAAVAGGWAVVFFSAEALRDGVVDLP
jgi:hypothetical protein